MRHLFLLSVLEPLLTIEIHSIKLRLTVVMLSLFFYVRTLSIFIYFSPMKVFPALYQILCDNGLSISIQFQKTLPVKTSQNRKSFENTSVFVTNVEICRSLNILPNIWWFSELEFSSIFSWVDEKKIQFTEKYIKISIPFFSLMKNLWFMLQ